MKELTLQEAALAWAQGKRVEATKGYGFKPISTIGTNGGVWNSSVFSDVGPEWRFRLAPEPPAKRYRPWTPEEVPVGARFRYRTITGCYSHCWMIAGWNMAFVHISNTARPTISFEDALNEQCVYSMDNGKTWLPCGVEVEA